MTRCREPYFVGIESKQPVLITLLNGIFHKYIELAPQSHLKDQHHAGALDLAYILCRRYGAPE